jgi:hypothetical protein
VAQGRGGARLRRTSEQIVGVVGVTASQTVGGEVTPPVIAQRGAVRGGELIECIDPISGRDIRGTVDVALVLNGAATVQQLARDGVAEGLADAVAGAPNRGGERGEA